MGVDPDGRFAFLIIIAVILISAAIAASTNVAVQASTVGWSNIDWGIKGVAGAAIIGGAAGAATMGVGALVGGGIAGGALGGAAGAATSYSGTAALQGGEFSAAGLGRAVAVGTVAGFFGAAGGACGGVRERSKARSPAVSWGSSSTRRSEATSRSKVWGCRWA